MWWESARGVMAGPVYGFPVAEKGSASLSGRRTTFWEGVEVEKRRKANSGSASSGSGSAEPAGWGSRSESEGGDAGGSLLVLVVGVGSDFNGEGCERGGRSRERRLERRALSFARSSAVSAVSGSGLEPWSEAES